jgi:Ser/Thr protein kinase RdoA (MazF antagonist)
VVDAPPHAGLSPVPLDYREATGEWARRIAQAAGAGLVERAVHSRAEPRGYYRITPAGGGPRLFGKVVSSADAPRLATAQRLSDKAVAAGIPAQRSASPPLPIGEEYALLLCEWIDGRFCTHLGVEMDSLGTTLARLHRFFGDAGAREPRLGDSTAIEALARSPGLNEASAQALDDLLRRRDEVRAKLGSPPQPIHNDLHPGNVLFDGEGQVAGVLDFEEALHSVGSPLVDLSWVIERFCFAARPPADAETLAARFIDAYRARAGSCAAPSGTFLDAIRWRSLSALAVLSGARLDDAEAADAEWRKFEAILAASGDWRPALERLEARLAG